MKYTWMRAVGMDATLMIKGWSVSSTFRFMPLNRMTSWSW